MHCSQIVFPVTSKCFIRRPPKPAVQRLRKEFEFEEMVNKNNEEEHGG